MFADWPGVETASAGLAADAEEPVTPEHLEWADIVFVMEPVHRRRLQQQFRRHLKAVRVVCLDIPDDYAFMDPALIALLKARVTRHL